MLILRCFFAHSNFQYSNINFQKENAQARFLLRPNTYILTPIPVSHQDLHRKESVPPQADTQRHLQC